MHTKEKGTAPAWLLLLRTLALEDRVSITLPTDLCIALFY